jgi:hypothetical protein
MNVTDFFLIFVQHPIIVTAFREGRHDAEGGGSITSDRQSEVYIYIYIYIFILP